MTKPNTGCERLEQVLELAQAYRGWTRKQLATALGRDVSNLVPASGVPKLDLVIRLAEVIEWSLEEVADAIWTNARETQSDGDDLHEDYSALIEGSLRAHREGRYRDMIPMARRAQDLATSQDQLALALHRESGAWDGLGYLREAYGSAHDSLRYQSDDSERRRATISNLANAKYGLWELEEAHQCASDLLARFELEPPRSRQDRVTEAFSLYVRGNSTRRLLSRDPTVQDHRAKCATTDLNRASNLFEELADGFNEPAYLGIARTCCAGSMESTAVLDPLKVDGALARFDSWLEPLQEGKTSVVGDHLESLGWCCIFAANIVLRHVDDPREQQHLMAIFTNKADEIADRLDNWAIRERILSMEVERRRRLGDWTGVDIEWTLDAEDLRVLAGVMGRFPSFRQTGWQILSRAVIVRDGRGSAV